jgi:hypothetical protein
VLTGTIFILGLLIVYSLVVTNPEVITDTQFEVCTCGREIAEGARVRSIKAARKARLKRKRNRDAWRELAAMPASIRCLANGQPGRDRAV